MIPSFISPMGNALVSSGWGADRSYRGTGSKHEGVDIPAPTGTPVYAAAGGKVITSKNAAPDPAGEYITILHPGGFITRYMHLSQRLVNTGASVSQGQLIGRVGRTGVQNSGSHLHFDVRADEAGLRSYAVSYGVPSTGFGKNIGGYRAVPAEALVPLNLPDKLKANAAAHNIPLYVGIGLSIVPLLVLGGLLWWSYTH